MPKKLTLTDVFDALSYNDEHARIIGQISACFGKDRSTSDVVTALAWSIAKDLYSESSLDRENLERIAFGLESASDKLLTLSMRLNDSHNDVLMK